MSKCLMFALAAVMALVMSQQVTSIFTSVMTKVSQTVSIEDCHKVNSGCYEPKRP